MGPNPMTYAPNHLTDAMLIADYCRRSLRAVSDTSLAALICARFSYFLRVTYLECDIFTMCFSLITILRGLEGRVFKYNLVT